MSITPRSIFIVDDNPAHRTLVRRAVSRTNLPHELLEAQGLSHARSMLFNGPSSRDIVLFIVDLNLGDGRGTELIRDLRKSSHYSSVPILVLSTSSLGVDIEESYKEGANCFVTKSVNPSQFLEGVSQSVKFLLSTSP